MTSCFVCKKDVGENYLVFTFDRTSDGYFTIGDPDESKHGLAVVVCKECQRRFVIDRIKELLEKDCKPKKEPFADRLRKQLERMME